VVEGAIEKQKDSLQLTVAPRRNNECALLTRRRQDGSKRLLVAFRSLLVNDPINYKV
jgi:hypothetical protein